MKILIIDENKVNRLYLRRLLNEHFSAFKKIDEAHSVAKALEATAQTNYDLILMEMELPDGMGFDILTVMKDFAHVIVVSARKEYAIEAFKYKVIDYLLKPINVTEFKNAVKRVLELNGHREEKWNRNTFHSTKNSTNDSQERMMISFNNTYITINIKDILYIKAFGKNSQIHMCDNKQYTSYKNLKEFESAMSTDLIRTHHSYLVNLKNIVSYLKETSHVLLNGGAEVPVSVRKKEELFRKFRVF
jgi:two-component system, LytTR family, response regulator